MLSRSYAIFAGIVLIVMGIAAYMAPQFLGAIVLTSLTATIWLLTGLVLLALGLFLRHSRITTTGDTDVRPQDSRLRWIVGIVGAIYLLWGVISLFTAPAAPLLALLQVLSMILVGLGALGIGSAVADAYASPRYRTEENLAM